MASYSQYFALPPFIFANPTSSILLPIVAGTLVGFSTQPKKTQKTYLEIEQPPFRPPPWVFAPAWTTLYGLMGYAAHRAWVAGHSSFDPTKTAVAERGAIIYTTQLVLNLIWMPLFFGAGRVAEAAVDIFALTGTVTYLAFTWYKLDKTAAYCLVPYLAWLGFASYLTIGVGYLNGWKLEKKTKKP